MCDVGANLVDHVLPDTGMRQWVLTAPYEVRRVMALRPEALSAVHRIFVKEIARWQKASAGLTDAETGSVTFVQRFHAALGPFVHFHVVQRDGVFTRDEDDAVRFHTGRAPTQKEIAEVAARVAVRVTKWLRRRKLLDERPAEERSNEAPELSALEACMQLALFGGTFLRVDGARVVEEDHGHGRGGKSPWVAEIEGFNVHAGITVHAGDRDGLERLCRYGARPPFSLERLSRLADGRVAYRLRKPRRNGATHLVMTPVQFLARLASIIPPPRFPLQRFSGVLAPNSPWRPAVVAMRPPARSGAEPPPAKRARKRKKGSAEDAVVPSPARDAPLPSGRTSLGDGLLPTRLDWATLLRRVYFEDVLVCPCGGRRRILADITEPAGIAAILDHLGLPSVALPLARARDPTEDAA